MVRDSSHDAVLDRVAGLKTEDAHGFDAHVMIRGEVYDGGIRAIRDRARQDIRGAAAGVRDMHHRDFYRLERAVEIKVELRELADSQFAIDFHQRVNFLAAVAVCLESNFRFEQFDLRRMSRLLGLVRFFLLTGYFRFFRGFRSGFLLALLGEVSRTCQREAGGPRNYQEKIRGNP